MGEEVIEPARLGADARAEARREYFKQYRERNRAKAAETTKAWRAANSQRSKDSIARWRAANQERVKQYRAENRDAAVRYSSKRRAIKLDAGGEYSQEDVDRIISAQKYKCAECRCSIKSRSTRHIDHIIPLSRGGSNDRRNIQLLCIGCNLAKGSSDPLAFAAKRGRLI